MPNPNGKDVPDRLTSALATILPKRSMIRIEYGEESE